MRRTANLLAVVCVSLAALAQPNTLEQANAALNAADLPKALALFRQATAADQQNGAAWEGLGTAAMRSDQLDEAERAFEHARALNWHPFLNQLNVARVAAKRGQTERAMQLLSELAATGKASHLRGFLQLPEFAPVRAAAGFARLQEAFLPCRAPEYRQFDFWVGNWKVESPTGQPLGTNLVTLEQDGCLLVEHWKSGRGVETGTSFNYYDIRDKKWHQLYIANNGNAGSFPAMAGDFRDGKMVLLTDVAADGTQQRWTWNVVGPGRVRQMAEQSADGGKTWNVTWDSVYVAAEH